MLVLVSSPINRPLTRVETVEAFHKYVSILSAQAEHGKNQPISEPLFRITKSCFFKFMLDLDPLISSVSLENRWDYLCKQLPLFFRSYIYSTTEFFEIKNCEMPLVIDSVLRWAQSRQPEYADQKDDSLNQQQPPHSVAPTGILKEMIERDNSILERLNGINSALLIISQDISESNKLYASARRDVMGNQVVSIDPQQLEKLVTMAAIPAAEEKTGRLTMSERITKAAVETGTGVLSAIQEGAKISTSQQTAKKIVTLFHNKLGHHIPGASTPIGQKAEEIMIPAFVHFAAAAFSDKIPKADFVQRACLRAITGTSKDGTDDMLEVLLPLFKEIVSMETMSEMAQQFAGEPAITGQEPAQLDEAKTNVLSAAVAQQIRELPAGEEFEIVIRRPKSQVEEKQLVPNFKE